MIIVEDIHGQRRDAQLPHQVPRRARAGVHLAGDAAGQAGPPPRGRPRRLRRLHLRGCVRSGLTASTTRSSTATCRISAFSSPRSTKTRANKEARAARGSDVFFETSEEPGARPRFLHPGDGDTAGRHLQHGGPHAERAGHLFGRGGASSATSRWSRSISRAPISCSR